MWLKRDPGECIICGCAHTACTSPDYATPSGRDVVIVRAARAEPRSPPSEEEAFTTATYSRAKHHPRRKRRGARAT